MKSSKRERTVSGVGSVVIRRDHRQDCRHVGLRYIVRYIATSSPVWQDSPPGRRFVTNVTRWSCLIRAFCQGLTRGNVQKYLIWRSVTVTGAGQVDELSLRLALESGHLVFAPFQSKAESGKLEPHQKRSNKAARCLTR
jgi:hypothetical protein